MSGEGALPYRPAIAVIDPAGEAQSRTLPIVAARRDLCEWRVWISAAGVATELTAERARQFARDVLAVCDVIDGVHPALRQAQDERSAGA